MMNLLSGKCVGCRQRKNKSDDAHTHIPGECRMTIVQERKGVPRRGHEPHDPRRKATDDVTTVDFRNFIVFFGPRPCHIEIRHLVKETSTIKFLGFEILKLKLRRLRLWKPIVHILILQICQILHPQAQHRPVGVDNHDQVVRHPHEALIQFNEFAAHTKMNKLDPQIPQTGCPLT